MTWTWNSIGLLVAVLGTTISPYMFFWQSAHRIEEMRAETGTPDASKPLPERSPRKAGTKLFLSRIDVFVGMLVSTLAMFAIMVSTSSTIGRNGPVTINTAADAAKALAPIAGPLASAVFSIGFIATGVLAVPVLASSGSIALAGLLGKPWGFDRSPKRAPLFYGLIGVGMLVLSAINGIAAAPFLVVIMVISGSRKLLGDYRNGPLAAVAGWATAAIMTVAGCAAVYIAIAQPH
jgi:Mn2+/Fe2+ NRAMP family transporter